MPGLELFLGENLEERVRHLFVISPGCPLLPFLQRYQSGIRLSGLCQDYLLPRVGTGEQLRKVGFCLMDIYNSHTIMLVQVMDLVNHIPKVL